MWHDGRLTVTRLEGTRNPVFFRGREQDRCCVLPGEHFVIGSTSFHVVEQQLNVSLDEQRPVTEQTFSAVALGRLRFRDAQGRMPR